MKQLDLFRDTPKPKPTAKPSLAKPEAITTHEPQRVEVYAFPYHARVGQARHVACLLQRKTTEKAKAGYWKQTVNAQVKQLERMGFSPTAIEQEISALHNLVEQMLTKAAQKSGSTP